MSRLNINDGTIINYLFIPFARTTNYGLKQFRVNGPRIWNSLPTNIKRATSMHVFLKNLDLEGYVNFSTATNTNKGGTIIYTKNVYDVTERIDLNICHDLYESIWIEIKNKKSKNIIWLHI